MSDPRPASRVSGATLASVVARSLAIQGSWNYRTMLGSGFAVAILPVLRRIYGSDAESLREPVERHMEHFNAHPYLATIALGAVTRLEEEGADPGTVRKLKTALRGPLGSLGDGLVWATVLPGTALAALALLWLGTPVWVAVALFLLLYNAVHLTLRVWGFQAGRRAGRDVGAILARADLSGWTRRLQPVVVLLLGAVAGAVIGGGRGLVEAGALWLALAAIGFVVGLLGGHRAWRPAAVVTVVAIGLLTFAGTVS